MADAAVLPDLQPLDLSVKSKLKIFTNVENSGSTPCTDPNHIPLDLSASRIRTPPSVTESSQDDSAASGVSSTFNHKPVLFCALCPFICANIMDLHLHTMQSHKGLSLPEELMKKYSLLTSAHSALTRLHEKKDAARLHCLHCGWQCELKLGEAFNTHVALQHTHNDGKYKCCYCSEIFYEQNSLREHVIRHTNVYRYICTTCSLAFSSESIISLHMLHRHSISPSAVLQPTAEGLPQEKNQKYSPPIRLYSSSKFKDMGICSSKPTNSESPKSQSDIVKELAVSVPKPRAIPQIQNHSESLTKHIEEAISRELKSKVPTTMADILLMRSSTEPDADQPLSSQNKNPLSLMSLLDKVVEESLRKVTPGTKPERPDLNFIVTFSDDEDDNQQKVSQSDAVKNDVSSSDSAVSRVCQGHELNSKVGTSYAVGDNKCDSSSYSSEMSPSERSTSESPPQTYRCDPENCRPRKRSFNDCCQPSSQASAVSDKKIRNK